MQPPLLLLSLSVGTFGVAGYLNHGRHYVANEVISAIKTVLIRKVCEGKLKIDGQFSID